MPFTRLSMLRGKSAEHKERVVESIYQSLRETLSVAENDRFFVINEYEHENFKFHSTFSGMNRSDDVLIVEITLNNTRTVEQKKSFYHDVVARLQTKCGAKADDIVICLVDVPKENWSMGQGLASFA